MSGAEEVFEGAGGRRGGLSNDLYDQKLAALHGAWTIRFGYGGLEA